MEQNVMDKLKSYFNKKVVNAKFQNAGKGYRLTESSTPTVSTSAQRPIQRIEPTPEAKIAGQVNVARLEAKVDNLNLAKFNNRSYESIMARARRELEQEKREIAEKEKQEKLKEEPENAENSISAMAVNGVYFRCPYLSDEILSKEEWKKKIREFLYEQLEEEESGLIACLIIQNCNMKREKVESCVETLGKYLENIMNNPEVEKYWKIRINNKAFQEKVYPIEGAMEFLKAAGFHKIKLLHNDVEEDFLVWSPENCDIQNLTILWEALKSAEPIPLELDRNLKVLLPMQASTQKELPSCFFNLTREELLREQKSRTEIIERSQMLRTKAMREREGKQHLNVYKYSLIRIRFPDGIILQGTFFAHEKMQSVFDFVSENLADSDTPFYFLILTSERITKESAGKTLYDLNLVPNAILKWVVENNSNKSWDSVGYLKEELLAYVESN